VGRLIYVTSGESKNFKSRRPNFLLFSSSSYVAGKRAPFFTGLSILEYMTRTLARKVVNQSPSNAVPNPEESREQVRRCERLK
jgi:hypothetical protein